MARLLKLFLIAMSLMETILLLRWRTILVFIVRVLRDCVIRGSVKCIVRFRLNTTTLISSTLNLFIFIPKLLGLGWVEVLR